MLDDEIERYIGVKAMPTLAMAILEQSGVCDYIDSVVEPDEQQILKPGKAVKLMVGGLFMGMGRRPLYKLHRDYATAPLEKLCGEGVTAKNLNSRAFSRVLDQLFESNLPARTFEIYELFQRRYQIVAYVYHMDATNFSVTAVVIDRDDPEAAIPEWNCHAKDGDNSKRVYNLITVTIDGGIVCYERPFDGSVSDPEMNEDTIRFLSDHIDVEAATVVADSKLVTGPLIELLFDNDLGFVSKCPESFGEHAKEQIVYSVLNSEMDPSSYKDGWEVYDCDMEVDGRMLRFVAFRTPEGSEGDVEYYRNQGVKQVEKKMKPLMKRSFACEEDANRAYSDALRAVGDTAYVITANINSQRVQDAYGKRGRPPKDWEPSYHLEYTLDIEWRFCPELAEEMSSTRQVRVLVTNLPRSQETMENPRLGATADDVLRIYMGQYKAEWTFRTAKSEFQVDKVWLHKPSRANAFMFVVTLATMVAGLITYLMRRQNVLKTAEGMIDDLNGLIVKHDRERDAERLSGPIDACDEFLRYLDLLEIDKDRLFTH